MVDIVKEIKKYFKDLKKYFKQVKKWNKRTLKELHNFEKKEKEIEKINNELLKLDSELSKIKFSFKNSSWARNIPKKYGSPGSNSWLTYVRQTSSLANFLKPYDGVVEKINQLKRKIRLIHGDIEDHSIEKMSVELSHATDLIKDMLVCIDKLHINGQKVPTLEKHIHDWQEWFDGSIGYLNDLKKHLHSDEAEGYLDNMKEWIQFLEYAEDSVFKNINEEFRQLRKYDVKTTNIIEGYGLYVSSTVKKILDSDGVLKNHIKQNILNFISEAKNATDVDERNTSTHYWRLLKNENGLVLGGLYGGRRILLKLDGHKLIIYEIVTHDHEYKSLTGRLKFNKYRIPSVEKYDKFIEL